MNIKLSFKFKFKFALERMDLNSNLTMIKNLLHKLGNGQGQACLEVVQARLEPVLPISGFHNLEIYTTVGIYGLLLKDFIFTFYALYFENLIFNNYEI